MSIPLPSLYTPSHSINQNPSGGAAPMSATALLQKAAQLGSTTSNASASSLLQGYGKSSSLSDHPSLDPHTFEGSSHLNDFVNSISGGSGHGGGGGSSSLFSGRLYNHGSNGGDEQQMDEYRRFHGNEQIKFDGNSNKFRRLEQDGRLTRDFLGVGRDEQQNGMNINMNMMNSLDSHGKSGSSSQSQAFGEGNFH